MPQEYHVETPDYKGPNRRDHCDCHIKMDKIIQDHDEELKDLRKERKERATLRATQHDHMWEGIKTKVEKKLFYFFASAILVIMGVVYSGIHEVDKQVAVLNSNVKTYFEQNRDIKEGIDKLDRKVENVDLKINNHMTATQSGRNNHSE